MTRALSAIRRFADSLEWQDIAALAAISAFVIVSGVIASGVSAVILAGRVA